MAGLLCLICLPVSLALLAIDRQARRRERRLMEGLRRGALYTRLHRQFSQIARRDLDQVRIEPSGITVTSVMPAHILLSFDFKQNGNEKRNACFTRLTAMLLFEDFAVLRAEGRYKLTRYRVFRINGRREYGYVYTLRRRHKDELAAARSTLRLRGY